MNDEWKCTHCETPIGPREQVRVDEGLVFHAYCWPAWLNARSAVYHSWREYAEEHCSPKTVVKEI